MTYDPLLSTSEDFEQLSGAGADAVPVGGPASEAVGDEPGVGPTVGGRDAQGGELAGAGLTPQEALPWVAGWCRDCPVRSRCPQEVCRIWRIEKEALAAVRAEAEATPRALGVPLRVLS